MAQLAGLIQAGDAGGCDFGRNPLWADVLAECANDKSMIEDCCCYDGSGKVEFQSAPVLKSSDEVREFTYLHPATALRWNRLGEQLLPYFCDVAARFSSVCFSNVKQHSGKQIAKKGLFAISWNRFCDAQRHLLSKGSCMGILDLRNFFPAVQPEMVQSLLPPFIDDTRLVDDLARFIDDIGKGLPQGSATSQMVAQILLSSVDLQMERYGFRYARYVDDIRIVGPTQLDVARDMAAFNEFIDAAGFRINSTKTRNHGPARARCIPRLGGCPSGINIEEYVVNEALLGFKPDSDIVALDEGPYPAGFLRSSANKVSRIPSADEPFDSVRLFEDHVAPQYAQDSHAVERYTIRQLLKKHPLLLRDYEQQLALERIGSERLYTSVVTPETAFAVGKDAIHGERSRKPEYQHRACAFLGVAASDASVSRSAIQALTSMYEGGMEPHLELEFCAIAKGLAKHRYAASLPIFRKGLEDCWPDVAVARIGATAGLDKDERNRFLDIAAKVSPATKLACRLVKAESQ